MASALPGPTDMRLLSRNVTPAAPSAPVTTTSRSWTFAPTGAGRLLPPRSLCTSPLDTLICPTSSAATVAFEVGPDAIELTYEDAAPAYDPFAALSPPDERAAVEERQVGGLGVLLVAAMAEQVRYRRAGDRNRISLLIRAAR